MLASLRNPLLAIAKMGGCAFSQTTQWASEELRVDYRQTLLNHWHMDDPGRDQFIRGLLVTVSWCGERL